MQDPDDLTTVITTYLCKGCKSFSASNLRAVRAHCAAAKYCKKKIAQLALDEARAQTEAARAASHAVCHGGLGQLELEGPGCDFEPETTVTSLSTFKFCPWTTVSVRIHESNREVGGQVVVRHGRQQSLVVNRSEFAADNNSDMQSEIEDSGSFFKTKFYCKRHHKTKFYCKRQLILLKDTTDTTERQKCIL